MQAERIPNTETRWIQRGLIALVIVALLAVALYAWGSRTNADTQQGAGMSRAVAALKVPPAADRFLRGGAVASVSVPKALNRSLRGGAVASVSVPKALNRSLRGGAVARVNVPPAVDRPPLRGGGTL